VFNVSGIYRDFTFPSEVKTVKVQLWGAGAGGAVGAVTATSRGDGGAYVECVIDVKNKKFVFVVGESGKNDVFTDKHTFIDVSYMIIILRRSRRTISNCVN
jgi:hypothetical protein